MHPLSDEEMPGRPVPFGFVGPQQARVTEQQDVNQGQTSAPAALSSLVVPALAPFIIYGMIGLLVTSGWIAYRGLVAEIKPGVPLYAALIVLIATAGAGGLFAYLRDVKRLAAAAVAQIIVASVATVAIIFGSEQPSRWIAVVAGVVTVANGFKMFRELRKKP